MKTSFIYFLVLLFVTNALITKYSSAQTDPPPPIIKRVSTPKPDDVQQSGDSFNLIASEAQAARFLTFATFGGSKSDIRALVGRNAADWLAEEFSKPATLLTGPVIATRREDGSYPNFNIVNDLIWERMMVADDQLRMRMTFALSQIFVASLETDPFFVSENVSYYDVLASGAFGTYRALLEDVTYSPLMARWLTFIRNRKGDPLTGRMPDENYAREVLQLFSIGLAELNLDGTAKLDDQGTPIATYKNEDVVGLSRVFTGLGYISGFNVRYPDLEGHISPLQMYNEEHSQLEKQFLGTTIPANTQGIASLNSAFDAIATHENVAPFISRMLIQRFTSSSPSPAYVERVATSFLAGEYTADNGRQFGSGQRGDLEATLAAILLDERIFVQPEIQPQGTGKVRDPLLKFIQWIRAYDVSDLDITNEGLLFDTRSQERLSQQFLRAPSVFNFYRPGYVPPQTEIAERGLTAPEFQLINASSVTGYINYMTSYVFDRTGPDKFNADYSEELALAEDPDALVRHLDLYLTGNRLSDTARIEIRGIIERMPLRSTSSFENDKLKRVKAAIMMVVASPAYQVIQ